MLDGRGVLLLGERVDRAELLAAPGEPVQARLQSLAGLIVERLLGRGWLELEPLGDAAQLRLGVIDLVAHPLSADLERRE